MNSSESDNPKDRPWLRPDQPKQPQPKQRRQSAEALPESAPFSALYAVLTVLMWLNTIVGVILVVAGFAGSPTATTGVAVLGGAITCALGRVLVHGANSLHILVQRGTGPGTRL